MRKRLGTIILGVLAVVALIGAPSADAATEFGDNCVANNATGGGPPVISIFQISSPGDPLPTAAPVSGVMTKWKVNLIPAPVTVPQTLKVLRLLGGKTAQVVGEASGNVISGLNTFDTRIPVQAGDRLAIVGTSEIGTLYCATPAEESLLGGYEGIAGGPGSTVSYEEFLEPARVPSIGVIEPDADNDGFGDETQDKCPQSAALQAECPVVKVEASSAIKKKGSVVVLVTVNSQAPVAVTGTVKLGKGKTAKLKGGTKTVAPGKITRFKLAFSKALKARLAELSSKQSLQLKVTATATDLIGRKTTDKLKVRLKGQASG